MALSSLLDRRQWLARTGAAAAVTAGLAAAGRLAALAQARPEPPARPDAFEHLEWDLGDTPAGPMRAVVSLPRGRAAGQRFPLLIAFHGRGECALGPARSAWGWPRDYELGASDYVLRHPPLTAAGMLDQVSPARLSALRSSLAAAPYEGLVVLTPTTPDVMQQSFGPLHLAFDRWVVERLVPRARRELPVLATREATGIDGVSLGGLHSLFTGLGHPETFGAVGAMQPAVRRRQGPVLERWRGAARGNARPPQRLRIVTSDRDPLRPDALALAQMLTEARVPFELRELVGPHDYPFNRGPGGVEMLLFHDRALRGQAAV